MILNLIISLIPLAFVLTGIALYNRRGERMLGFYNAMVYKPKARKLYMRIVLFTLLIIHYLFSLAHIEDFGIILSTILIIILYRQKTAERILHFFHRDEWTFRILAGAAVLIVIVIPHTLTLGITTILLLITSLFFPSKIAIQKAVTDSFIDTDDLVNSFYTFKLRNVHVDSGSKDDKPMNK